MLSLRYRMHVFFESFQISPVPLRMWQSLLFIVATIEGAAIKPASEGGGGRHGWVPDIPCKLLSYGVRIVVKLLSSPFNLFRC